MAVIEAGALFSPAETEDPAVPGDPWTRLRFLYGQLLSARDFTAEQRALLLRRRLHLALLHGAGTVWGLRVHDGPEAEPEPRPELVVAEGLAVDALGREIYVDQDQCLDVTALHDNPLWERLEKVERPGEDREVRRAWVVLSYLACLSDRVPAIEPPCSHESDLAPYGRINDRFRIDLVEAPPEPELLDLQRPWLTDREPRDNPRGWASPREALLDHLLNLGRDDLPPLSTYWLQSQEAPLLLASVELVREAGGGLERTGVLAVDNRPRALLPSSQLLAEQLFGQRLAGADRREPLCLVALESNEAAAGPGDGAVFRLAFSRPLAALNAATRKAVVGLRVLDSGAWKDAFDGAEIVDAELTVKGKAMAAGAVYQLHLNGAGPAPLVGAAGEPLAGWWGDGLPLHGGARDVSIVRTWQPGA